MPRPKLQFRIHLLYVHMHQDIMKMDPRYRAVCFDMDGTLLNTKVDYGKMADVVFDEMVKIGVPEDVIDRNSGYKFNLESGINYLISHGRIDDVHKAGRNAWKGARDIEMERVNEAVPFEGSLNLLKRIHALGLRTGLLTRGCREYAEAATKICGVYDELDSIVARDDYSEQEAKPSPKAMEHIAERLNVSPEEILYFGDHLFDYQCARDSGAGFIAVLTGTYTREDWGKEDVVIYDSVTDFYKNLE